jgi:hypothetical protein
MRNDMLEEKGYNLIQHAYTQTYYIYILYINVPMFPGRVKGVHHITSHHQFWLNERQRPIDKKSFIFIRLSNLQDIEMGFLMGAQTDTEEK